MTPLTMFLTVIALAVVVLMAMLIPTLYQIRMTSKKLKETVEQVGVELVPLIKSATATSDELQTLTASINDKMDQTNILFNELQEAGHVLLATTHILKNKISPAFIQIAGLNAGIKAFTNFFTR
ncbi:MAG: DUF948 domain-containing protein [Desulfurivibrionaceae bacterium]|nr:DUF948 domain-containing protein [Desulfurivibrionaceae bacterium]